MIRRRGSRRFLTLSLGQAVGGTRLLRLMISIRLLLFIMVYGL